jgi:hypothetical protein
MKPLCWIVLSFACVIPACADFRTAAAGQPKCVIIQQAGATAPFLGFKYLSPAEELWREAEKSIEGQPELQTRVRVARWPLSCVWLARWEPLRKDCIEAGAVWPQPDSRKDFAEGWLAQVTATNNPSWARVNLLSEAGLTPQKFAARFAKDPKALAARK